MGFMGLDFLKESKQDEIENEEDLEIFSTKTLDVYYTSAVDFKYNIVKGDIWAWDDGYDLNIAWESAISKLKDDAFNCNADCVVDVKVKVIPCGGDSSNTFFTVYATGVAVKKFNLD